MTAPQGMVIEKRPVDAKDVAFYHPAVHGPKNLRKRHLSRVARREARKTLKRLLQSVLNPAPEAEKRIGPYLGRYTDSETGRWWDLRPDDAEPRGILIMGPPGSGKSACNFIPTLLSFPESAFVYDPKFELYYLTAGYRRDRLRNKILLFAPTRPDLSCHINILDSIRWGTIFEVADVQNVVKLILDPSDKAAEGAEAHWIATGSVLLECVILFLHYTDPANCTLRGCYDFLSDPRWVDNPEAKTTAVDEALKYMLTVPHDPDRDEAAALRNGWRDAHDRPSPFHKLITHAATDLRGRAPNEKSGIVSTTTRFLKPFQDDVLAELTSRSDFSFDDLMNYETPVTLYFCIPPSDVARLRVIVRLYLNLLVRAHTGDNALTYVDGTPVYRYRWRCLLAVDEFAQLGKQEQFMLALSVMRSYGLWPMLGVQIPNQIYDSFGRYQAVTGMLFYKVFYAPNDIDAAKWISEQLGSTTVTSEEMAVSGPRFGPKMQASHSVKLSKEPLMEPAALTEMQPNEVIITATSQPPIRGTSVYWKHNAEFRRRSGDKMAGGKFPAPERSDVIVEHATRPVPRRKPRDEQASVSPASPPNDPPSETSSAEALEPVAAAVANAAAAPQPGATSSNAGGTDPLAAAKAILQGALSGGLEMLDGGDEVVEPAVATEISENTKPKAASDPETATVAPLSPDMQQYLALAEGLEDRELDQYYDDESPAYEAEESEEE